MTSTELAQIELQAQSTTDSFDAETVLAIVHEAQARSAHAAAAEAALEEAKRVLQNFRVLTWWAEVPVTIKVNHPSRSGTEVRELINLRAAALHALSASPPSTPEDR